MGVDLARSATAGGSGSASRKTTVAVTANRTTATSGGVGSLNIPLIVTVDVIAGQVVDIDASWNGFSDADNILFWGIRRNGAGMLAKGTWYSAGGGTRPNSGSTGFTDTAPPAGQVTYELMFGQFNAGNITIVGVTDGSANMGIAGNTGGGGSQISATVRSP